MGDSGGAAGRTSEESMAASPGDDGEEGVGIAIGIAVGNGSVVVLDTGVVVES